MSQNVWIAGLFCVACAGAAAQQHHDNASGATAGRATMKNPAGTTVGNAVLQDTPRGILLKVDFRGMASGVHAFHIHETGRCESPTFESAGGHYAPDGHEHGILDAKGPHAGDLPNVHVPASGILSVEYFLRDLTLGSGQRHSLLDADGSALVVHRGMDDYRTDPAGDAGTRIACGVVMR